MSTKPLLELHIVGHGFARAARQAGRLGLVLQTVLTPPATGWRRLWCIMVGHQPDLLTDAERDIWTCRCRAARETGERRRRLRER